jgi:TetR/AcrR family transcriptional regulator, transcriptional repressor for nem operon
LNDRSSRRSFGIKAKKDDPAASGATRDRIVAAASAAWHAKSFDGVGVAEICRLASVHKGSFFHFFPSKEALLLSILEGRAKALRTTLLASAFKPDVPPLARLRRFFDAAFESAAEERRLTGSFRGCPIGNVLSELATRDEAVRKASASALDVLRESFLEALREARRDGSLPSDRNPEATADALLAFMQGMALLGKAYRDVDRLRDAAGATLDALLGPARKSRARMRPVAPPKRPLPKPKA